MKTKLKNAVNLDKELYAVFKNGNFVEAVYCLDDNRYDNSDKYIRMMERKLGLKGFSYLFGSKAKAELPKGYKPRTYNPKLSFSRSDKEFAVFRAKFRKVSDDGVNYED